MIIIYRFAHGGEIVSFFTIPIGAFIKRPHYVKLKRLFSDSRDACPYKYDKIYRFAYGGEVVLKRLFS